MKFRYDGDVEVEVVDSGDIVQASVDGRASAVSVWSAAGGGMAIRSSEGRVSVVHCVNVDGTWYVAIDGEHYEILQAQPGRKRAVSEGDGALEAPMPGTVLEVRVAQGDIVSTGQVLMVVEAMKMEHAIAAPRDGTVIQIYFEVGANVAPGDTLVELE